MAVVEAVKVEPLAVVEKDEQVEFVWGRKRGIGGKRKEVQFYESFTYDGVEYALYDCVYMHKEGELPYIGKIIKIWENPDKSRKIKIHWFFRPSEILYHLKDVKVAENEVFPASGEGTGLANVNPLETSEKRNSFPDEKNSHDLGDATATGKSSHLVGRSDAQSSSIREDASHGDANDSHIEQQSTMKGNVASVLVVNSKIATTVVPKQNTLSEENARCTVKIDKKVNKPSIELVEAGDKGKPLKDLGIVENRPAKRIKVNGSVTLLEDKGGNSVQKSTDSGYDKEVVGTGAAPSEERKKSGDSKLSGGLDKNTQIRKDGAALDIRPPKKANIDSLKVKDGRDKSNMSIGIPVDNIGKLPKSAGTSPKEVERMEGKNFVVMQRPVAESSKWFKAPSWEEVMQTSNEQGTLVLLENLNPDYTSGEVEDIIWHACRENCTAKMVQRTAFFSPYYGRALVAFKTREAAERVSKKLADGCLMVSNQRPLIASFVTLPKMDGNTPFSGHLCVDKLRLQLQREMKEAVSTSHCSQPNTIEHEMGIEWRLLQSRSDSWWDRLYKQQKEDLRKTASELKRK
ncbi:unnamed protein product [Withania somnifera]